MPAPVKHTCPNIDKLIKGINQALKLCRDGESGYGEPKDIFSEIHDELWGMDDVLEELRQSNSSLREWGEKLENENKNMEQEVGNLFDTCELQKEEITDLKQTIKDLEDDLNNVLLP